MIVVSDTTPLRYLIEIEEIDCLQSLFGRVIISQKVFTELQGKKTPSKVAAWIQNHPAWIEVRQADISLFTPQKKIQRGEHEAIAIAVELKAGWLLIDDNDAIKEAQQINLATLRLLTILELAAARRLLDLSSAIEKMRHTSFHLPSPELVAAALERDRQRHQSHP